MTETCFPIVVIVFGLPGSGKSYFAERLAERMNAAYLSSDRIRNKILQNKTYSDVEKQLVYKEMLTRMNAGIDQNKNVLLDATFYRKDIRQLFTQEAQRRSLAFFIEVCADASVIRSRTEKKRPESDADMEVYKKIKNEWQPLPFPHLILQSTNNNIEEMLQKATDHLKLNHEN